MAVLLFANGDMPDYDGLSWVQPFLAQASLIVAADGGVRYVRQLGRWPDVVVGDMDSMPASWEQELNAAQVQIVHYPAAKDETDLELALLYAAAHSDAAEPLLIFAALGGRLDQTLANVLLLAHPALAGRSVRLVEPFQQAWLVRQETVIHGQVGDKVSLIPLGGAVEVAYTSGLAWPLHHDTLAFGPARGVSNVMEAPLVTIRLAQGQALCVHTQREWQR